MGVRSFLIAVESAEQVRMIKKWSDIIAGCLYDIMPEEEFDEDRLAEEMRPVMKLLQSGRLTYEGKDAGTGDANFEAPYGFKYWCGKLWLLLTTHTLGEATIQVLMEHILPGVAWTRVSNLPDWYHDIPHIPFSREGDRWEKHAAEVETLLKTRTIVSYKTISDDGLFEGCIPFKSIGAEPEIKALHKYSDPPEVIASPSKVEESGLPLPAS